MTPTLADLLAEHARADSKAAALLGVDGLLVTVATGGLAVTSPGPAALAVAVAGLTMLAAAIVVATQAIRPALTVGGHRCGWVAWADGGADGEVPDVGEIGTVDVVALARLARRKYLLVRAGVDLTTAGLLLLAAAAIVAAVS